jgi:hypothetical protein
MTDQADSQMSWALFVPSYAHFVSLAIREKLMDDEQLEGCQCGAIRYAISGTQSRCSVPCTMSPNDALLSPGRCSRNHRSIHRLSPALYASSPKRTRILPTCGTQISYGKLHPWSYRYYSGSLDRPQAVTPAYIGFKPPWLNLQILAGTGFPPFGDCPGLEAGT